MKKIFFPIIILLLSLGVVAQTNPNRTAKTKVSDALALLPAQNQSIYNRLMGDLVSTGTEGVEMLTGMFNSVNNVPVNYALSGWAAYVSASDSRAEKETFTRGIIDGLKKASDNEVKAFYMGLLGLAGNDECVPALASYIGSGLTDHAVAALVSIGGDDSRRVIAEAIKRQNIREDILAKAAGDLKVPGVEKDLIGWLPGADAETVENVYYALARTGGTESLGVLKKAAESVGYADDPAKSVEAYTDLLTRFGEEGYARQQTLKEALSLNDKALKKKRYNAALDGFSVVCAIEGGGVMPRVLKAMDNPSRYYRMGVLYIAGSVMTEKSYVELLAKAGKLKSDEAKADIITAAGNSGYPGLVGSITPYIGNPDDEVNIAAMSAASLLGGDGVPELIAAQMAGRDKPEAVLKVAKQSLLSYKGDVGGVAAEVAGNGKSVDGRVMAISILASRRATEKAGLVMELTGDQSEKISEAAYEALPFVVTADDRAELYKMLDASGGKALPQVQKAVIAAFPEGNAGDKSADVSGRMSKAGANSYKYLVPLAATGDVAVLGVITERYNKGNDLERGEALRALLQWKGMEAADYIYDIAAGSRSAEALDGHINLTARSRETPEMKVIMLTDAMEIAWTPAQKQKILRIAANLPIFQSFIFASGYLDDADADVRQRAAEAVMNVGLSNKSFYGPVIADALKKASSILSGPDSSYQRESIAKHLAGFPAEDGYVSMFNGRDLAGWKGLVANPVARGKMSPAELARRQEKADEIMRRDWVVKDGILIYEGKGGENLCTEKQYGDFEMYVDWKLYPDSDEADGGIYLRGSPQVQMWDIARTNVGAQVGSGGLYNNKIHPSDPLKVADNKLGKWNTFYIKMVGERVTVFLNGEKVVDNVILENYWNRSQPIFPVEQIELQAHGTRVGYRNIYINELPRVEPYKLTPEEEKEGFEVLFDGVSMHNWKGNTTDYVAEDGMIVLYPENGSGGNLYTKDEFGDFVFRFEFMLTPGANNGLGIRTPDEGDAAYVGMELQILDDDAPIYAKLAEWQYHGSVYGVIPAKRGALKPLGEWNYQEVYAKGDHIRIMLNGEVILDGNIREASKNGTIDGKEHPGLFNKSGHIAFLGHGSVVKFKNIRVKELK